MRLPRMSLYMEKGLSPAALKDLFVEKKESEVTEMEMSLNKMEPREMRSPGSQENSVLMRRQ